MMHKQSQGMKIRQEEIVIALLVIIGLGAMIFDPLSFRVDKIVENNGHKYKQSTILMDMVLILSNFIMAAFFSLNEMLLKSDNSLKYFFLLNFFIMITTCLVAIVFEGARLDTHPNFGLFGWIHKEHAFWNVFMDGFIGTLLATYGPIVCIQYFPTPYVLNLFLLEPLIAQLFGLIAGIDAFPSILSVAGYLAIAFSLYRINMRDMIAN
jgi:hypothetical protein